MYVCFTLALLHVSLLALEGMIIFSLVVAFNAVATNAALVRT